MLSSDAELIVTSLNAEIPVPKGTVVAVPDGGTVAPGSPIYRIRVESGGVVRRSEEEGVVTSIAVAAEDGSEERFHIPRGTRPAVRDGARLAAGDSIDICHRENKPAVVFFDGLETEAGAPGSDLRLVTAEGGRIRVELREESYPLPHGALVQVRHGQQVHVGQHLYRWDPYHRLFIAEKQGALKLCQVEGGRHRPQGHRSAPPCA